jgi:hypothetical protein
LSVDENGIQRWFADGEMNTCYMALNHHVVQGRGEQIALIYDSPVTSAKMQFTYSELLEKVARFAGLLQISGVDKGGAGRDLYAHDQRSRYCDAGGRSDCCRAFSSVRWFLR